MYSRPISAAGAPSAERLGHCRSIGIGKEFALMEGQLILARLLQRYRVSAVPGRTTRLHVATTLRTSGGVWLQLEPRPGR
ncbi:hypothetical protein WME73_10325 [Sorangium sp. So ce302]|uniref:hypothetical protein n=1 Tax=Sorangium sp. So ce302 TaxID=3133297 RepID=UPI003F5F6708